MRGLVILSLFIGAGAGYALFYRRFEQRDIVAELRDNLKIANDQIIDMQEEIDELQAQNDLFRQKTTELLEKNDELSDVVAELGKYYVHIKKASEKTAELSKYLHEPDAEIEGKIWSLDTDQSSQKRFF